MYTSTLSLLHLAHSSSHYSIKVLSPSACLNGFSLSNTIGRNRGLLELDLKLDDLLEMQQNNVQLLDLKYVQFSVSRILALLNRVVSKGR